VIIRNERSLAGHPSSESNEELGVEISPKKKRKKKDEYSRVDKMVQIVSKGKFLQHPIKNLVLRIYQRTWIILKQR
jgi:hypothetical protein